MSKITLTDIGSIANQPTTAATSINSNSDIISDAIDNTLSRDGTAPNAMEAVLDMNGQQIVNLPQPLLDSSPLRYSDLNTFLDGGTISNIPAGGATNEILTKSSSADYDVEWAPVVTGLAAGVATFLATPSSANLAAALTNETGSGSAVFATSPTLVTPVLGTPTSGTLTSCTGLPLTTGVTGTLPVANGGTGDTGSAWTVYTPVITSGTGTVTAATITATAAYKRIGKSVFIRGTIAITDVGTGTPGSYVVASLPVTATGYGIVPGTLTNTGVDVTGVINNGAIIAFTKYDSTGVWTNGNQIAFSGIYEST